jgi:hypothetical protein
MTIKEVSEEQAPVAIISHPVILPDRYKSVSYRYYNDKLWAPSNRTIQKDNYDSWNSYLSQKERIKNIREYVDRLLIINGLLYEQSGEPRYVICTFGLGYNHGSTGLFAEDYYNQNISKKRYFRIDERDKAVKEATRIAEARGDTKSLPIIPWVEYDIIIPESVKLCPAKEHGDGCPFINSIEHIVETVKDPLVSGLMAVSLALSPTNAPD